MIKLTLDSAFAFLLLIPQKFFRRIFSRTAPIITLARIGRGPTSWEAQVFDKNNAIFNEDIDACPPVGGAP